MGKFTKISRQAFAGMQLDAGVLLRQFDPETAAVPADADIICATAGGVEASCEASYKDLGEDVDNCPANMMELKYLQDWTCTLRFKALEITPETLRLALGAADTDGDLVYPRGHLKDGDFGEIWWVGDRADGGMAAVCLSNALSKEGLKFQSKAAGKGELDVELLGHASFAEPGAPPMCFYAAAGEAEA
ncbi:MAG: hypothetical protein IJJ85_05890 [Clostridia bacterium]|nr:hypothetical protein [Clostridia bacterium]